MSEDDQDNTNRASQRRRKNDEDPNEAMDESDQVIKAGRHFIILHSLWLHRGEATFKVEYDPDFDLAERFENKDTNIQAQLHEIKEVLGDKLFADIPSETWIAKVVSPVQLVYETIR